MAALVMLFAILLFLPSSMAKNILYEGESLKTGESLTEGNFKFTMMSDDCTLVLNDNDQTVWSTNTGGKGTSCYAHVQTDGNVVIRYDKAHRNRNVVLYDSKWATNTYTANSEGFVVAKRDHNDTSIMTEVVVPAADEPANRKIAMATNN
ncbi:mannose-specific lectin-like [Zingiber officinale]|uniref:Bulb-type lectin domain-containing protein n=1 Tax=Zingiber officinale TaxID=94328 RepID=A0A8J5C755_ZINOF|nr:mannose-specific lectin-like [Zingiber officinale]KAG6468575.1 hypothetical protein ZIOFF_073263 [Zingiber officinale]